MFLNKRKVIFLISAVSLLFLLIFNQVKSQELKVVDGDTIHLNGESLSIYLVRSGYAFAYRRYSKKFVKDEDYAKANQIGMWAMKFDYPWEYRKNN